MGWNPPHPHPYGTEKTEKVKRAGKLKINLQIYNTINYVKKLFKKINFKFYMFFGFRTAKTADVHCNLLPVIAKIYFKFIKMHLIVAPQIKINVVSTLV